MVQINDVSMNHDNRKIVIRFTPKTSEYDIQAAQSLPITSVRHKLVIREDHSTSYTWYKEEGGKDKCIDLTIILVDSEGNQVRNRKVPLKALLVYYRGQYFSQQTINPVPQQNILALAPDCRLLIDENGDGVFKMRINEVSTRHQGQMFQVKNIRLSSFISIICYPSIPHNRF